MLKPQDYPTLRAAQSAALVAGDLWRATALPAHGRGPRGRPAQQPVTRRFGVRTVGSFVLPSGGRAFTVNGRTIRMTGGAWIPDFLMSWSAQRYRDEVRLMAEGNHTIVRVNGCGIVPPGGLLRRLRPPRPVGLAGPLADLDHGVRDDAKPACPLRSGGLSRQHEGLHLPAARAAEPVALVRLQRGVPAGRHRPAVAERNSARPGRHAAVAAQFPREPPWHKEPMCMSGSGGPYGRVRLPEYFRLYAQDPAFTCQERDRHGVRRRRSTPSSKAIPDYEQPEPAWSP